MALTLLAGPAFGQTHPSGKVSTIFHGPLSTQLASADSMAVSITQGGIVPIYSSATTIQPGSWISIFGSNLAPGTNELERRFPDHARRGLLSRSTTNSLISTSSRQARSTLRRPTIPRPEPSSPGEDSHRDCYIKRYSGPLWPVIQRSGRQIRGPVRSCGSIARVHKARDFRLPRANRKLSRVPDGSRQSGRRRGTLRRRLRTDGSVVSAGQVIPPGDFGTTLATIRCSSSSTA